MKFTISLANYYYHYFFFSRTGILIRKTLMKLNRERPVYVFTILKCIYLVNYTKENKRLDNSHDCSISWLK